MLDIKPQIQQTETHLIMPGLATAHSHAFQRALRGRTQRRATTASSFWSWRGLMYKLVGNLNPDDIYDVARLAYAELAMSGVTAVGEFHYLHHDFDGRPYANRIETAEAVIRAALDVGIRICLIRTGYLRGGHNRPLEPAQARFSDQDVDLILQDIETLRQKYRQNPLVSVAVAAHSIRALPLEATKILADYASSHNLPFHMHVCEQRQELAESVAEHGQTPIIVLAEQGVLSERFVGVHATHLAPQEIKLLGEAGVFVCICRTTERDLGDGLPQISELRQAGTRLCVGVDSHCGENAFEEIRAIEFDERSRLEARHTVAEAPDLLDIGSRLGYMACDMAEMWSQDQVYLRRDDPALVGLDEKYAVDGVIFAATPRAIEQVWVNGMGIVEDGYHRDLADILARYKTCLGKI